MALDYISCKQFCVRVSISEQLITLNETDFTFNKFPGYTIALFDHIEWKLLINRTTLCDPNENGLKDFSSYYVFPLYIFAQSCFVTI